MLAALPWCITGILSFSAHLDKGRGLRFVGADTPIHQCLIKYNCLLGCFLNNLIKVFPFCLASHHCLTFLLGDGAELGDLGVHLSLQF